MCSFPTRKHITCSVIILCQLHFLYFLMKIFECRVHSIIPDRQKTESQRPDPIFRIAQIPVLPYSSKLDDFSFIAVSCPYSVILFS